jgi:hypothetical protein
VTALKVRTRALSLVNGATNRQIASSSRTHRFAARDLPFAPGDATAGTENELQAVVVGMSADVDLPQSLLESGYYRNLTRRVRAGETPTQRVINLQRYLAANGEGVWENSWVRFPLHILSEFARTTLDDDLSAASTKATIKDHGSRPQRADYTRFIFEKNGETFVRVPISYLMKLALADFAGCSFAAQNVCAKIYQKPNFGCSSNVSDSSFNPFNLPRHTSIQLQKLVARLMKHFLNDLISPETFSFHVVRSKEAENLGAGVAREMMRRFLFSHLLIEWANNNFALEATGQRALIYFAPNTPARQKELNDCISDAFFRDLFINPCLSGFDDGEAKRDYMRLAHQIMSRSQLNALAKLRDAGIIANNLVVLPNTSNVSLSNNGTHLSMGSRKLSAALAARSGAYTPTDEKGTGDLVIKICEHFLPLFVGTYTAAPFRFSFDEFHPETLLGFLPHELDYTHLRMLWRHWTRKADIRILNRARTPSGPKWIDVLIARLFRLGGDFVPDVRLIDYPVAWLATENSSALDGSLGNVERLKSDLEEMGVSDKKLKLYQLIALREHARIGFSGFEGRHYSAFHSFQKDFARAADMQQFIIVLAFKYALSGAFTHADFPDDPTHESERRQPFFCAAINLPVFYIRFETRNKLLRRLISYMKETRHSEIRPSRRHSGYVRVPLEEYRRALLEMLNHEREIIEMLGIQETLNDLEARLRDEHSRASGKLTRGTMETLGESSRVDPMTIEAREFNRAAERYYREALRRQHLKEAFAELRAEVAQNLSLEESNTREIVRCVLGDRSALEFLDQIECALLDDKLSIINLRQLLFIMLGVIADAERHFDGKG